MQNRKPFRTLVICDIQRMYEDHFEFKKNRFVEWLNRTKFNKYIIFYNGLDSCGDVDESGMIDYYLNMGISDRVLNSSSLYDKGCGEYFEKWEEHPQLSPEYLETLVKYVWDNHHKSFYKIGDNTPSIFQKLTKYEDSYAFRLNSSIEILDTVRYTDITLIGGMRTYCLEELIINLKALNAKFKLNKEFLYGE